MHGGGASHSRAQFSAGALDDEKPESPRSGCSRVPTTPTAWRWPLASQWAARIAEEFFRQGDAKLALEM